MVKANACGLGWCHVGQAAAINGWGERRRRRGRRTAGSEVVVEEGESLRSVKQPTQLEYQEKMSSQRSYAAASRTSRRL